MKNVLFIAFLSVLVSCGSQKIVTYEYNVVARGYKQNIKVNKQNVEVVSNTISNKNGVERQSGVTSPELWKALQSGTKKIKLTEISRLESPTNKRQLDGAMFANLVLITLDSTYKSAGFDHGKPPVMLKTVVDSLVSVGRLK
jgi:hypothetical protein